jgi:Flp pilus assembly protein TadG
MSILSNLRILGNRFVESEKGAMPVEGVLASTFLIWWYIASFQFFDAYRQKNINQKGAYTVADLISRETNAIDADYVEGMNTLFDYLTFSRRPTTIRVSSVFWDDDNNMNKIAWSYATGATGGLTTAELQARSNRIPTMAVGDYVIVVETFMAYEPILNTGLKAQWFQQFITTRPRFTTCIAWNPHDGTIPACIYDTDIDPSDNVADDQTPTDSIDPGA